MILITTCFHICPAHVLKENHNLKSPETSPEDSIKMENIQNLSITENQKAWTEPLINKA